MARRLAQCILIAASTAPVAAITSQLFKRPLQLKATRDLASEATGTVVADSTEGAAPEAKRTLAPEAIRSLASENMMRRGVHKRSLHQRAHAAKAAHIHSLAKHHAKAKPASEDERNGAFEIASAGSVWVEQRDVNEDPQEPQVREDIAADESSESDVQQKHQAVTVAPAVLPATPPPAAVLPATEPPAAVPAAPTAAPVAAAPAAVAAAPGAAAPVVAAPAAAAAAAAAAAVPAVQPTVPLPAAGVPLVMSPITAAPQAGVVGVVAASPGIAPAEDISGEKRMILIVIIVAAVVYMLYLFIGHCLRQRRRNEQVMRLSEATRGMAGINSTASFANRMKSTRSMPAVARATTAVARLKQETSDDEGAGSSRGSKFQQSGNDHQNKAIKSSRSDPAGVKMYSGAASNSTKHTTFQSSSHDQADGGSSDVDDSEHSQQLSFATKQSYRDRRLVNQQKTVK